MTPALAIVPKPDRPQTLADRIAELQADLRTLNAEQVDAMRAHIVAGIDAAREVCANPSQPPGIQQIAEQLIRDAEGLVLSLDCIRARAE